ncbi:aldo/keto reductase [Draconibacterium orientale]|uniref:aldo/keto reductase n=1 Tax=Draconibacterium orientale TaxID=1168034 RepID=UPI002ABD451C|nr:aldo/keto reductase [Draconibacterium orientale]
MMKNLLLNDGNELPIIGFGTYKSTEQEAIDAVQFALKNGYRLIDTAAFYFNEEAVGKGIKASGIPREEIIVTTKLWRDYLGYESTKKELEKSLKKLDLDYIDLYLIHWPANARNYNNWQETNADSWRAMEELQAEGKIKSIGVSNFWQEHLESLFQTAKVKPAVNQIEFHPGYWQPELTAYCKKHGIVPEAWSPLARGRVFHNETLKQIAQNHQQPIAKVCLRWITQHEVVVIPKSTTHERILDNLDVFGFELTPGEMNLIDNLPEMGFSGELPNIWPERLPLT